MSEQNLFATIFAASVTGWAKYLRETGTIISNQVKCLFLMIFVVVFFSCGQNTIEFLFLMSKVTGWYPKDHTTIFRNLYNPYFLN